MMQISCQKPRDGEWDEESVHSPDGIAELRRVLKEGLYRLYSGIAMSMWRYEGMDDERLQAMSLMSRDTVPERFLHRNGQCVWFEYAGSIHCLPYTYNSEGINIYGQPASWSPIPVGWSDMLSRGKSLIADEIRDLKLDLENSVIMWNDLSASPEMEYVRELIAELVDNTLTMNQLQLLAKVPLVFEVSEDNVLSAKNFYQSVASNHPAVFVNKWGEKTQPVALATGVKIDPALFELYDRFECQLLEFLGFPCVPITKRAQQSVSEVESHEMKIYARRQEKLKVREKAIEKVNQMFGTNITVISVVDERKDFIFGLEEGPDNGPDKPGADAKTDN